MSLKKGFKTADQLAREQGNTPGPTPAADNQEQNQSSNPAPEQQTPTTPKSGNGEDQGFNFNEELQRVSGGRFNTFDDVIARNKEYKQLVADKQKLETERYASSQVEAIDKYIRETGSTAEDYFKVQMKDWTKASTDELLAISAREKYGDSLTNDQIQLLMSRDYGTATKAPVEPNVSEFNGDVEAYNTALADYNSKLESYKLSEAIRVSESEKVRAKMIEAQNQNKLPQGVNSQEAAIQEQQRVVDQFNTLNSESIKDIKPITFNTDKGNPFNYSISQDKHQELVAQTKEAILGGGLIKDFMDESGNIKDMNGLQQLVYFVNNKDKIIEAAIKFGADKSNEQRVNGKPNTTQTPNPSRPNAAPSNQSRKTIAQQFYNR